MGIRKKIDISCNKSILSINLTGVVGGAQKRYITLYNHISEKRDNYCLIINDSLYSTYKKNKILNTDKNVFVLQLITKKSHNFSDKMDVYKSETLEKRKKTKIRLFLGKHKYLLRLIIKWFSFAFQLRRIIRQNKISTVYSVWFGGIWAWPLKRLFDFKLIYSANSSSFINLKKPYWNFLDSEYWVLKYSDKIDFLSRSMVRLLEKKIGPISPSRILISPNSFINYENYYPEYPKNNVAVFMARLTPIKNPILFLEAIRILYKNKPNFQKIKFYIFGEGPLADNIITFIQKNKLQNVHFEGLVYEPSKYLRKSKVFVSIQEDENYPSQSLLEAMACENAIIASDVGETRLLVTENEGILVNLDAEKIANAIDKLFSTPELTERLGKSARKKAIENHNIEKFTNYFYSINEK